jgi:hypothetical protein
MAWHVTMRRTKIDDAPGCSATIHMMGNVYTHAKNKLNGNSLGHTDRDRSISDVEKMTDNTSQDHDDKR